MNKLLLLSCLTFTSLVYCMDADKKNENTAIPPSENTAISQTEWTEPYTISILHFDKDDKPVYIRMYDKAPVDGGLNFPVTEDEVTRFFAAQKNIG